MYMPLVFCGRDKDNFYVNGRFFYERFRKERKS